MDSLAFTILFARWIKTFTHIRFRFSKWSILHLSKLVQRTILLLRLRLGDEVKHARIFSPSKNYSYSKQRMSYPAENKWITINWQFLNSFLNFREIKNPILQSRFFSQFFLLHQIFFSILLITRNEWIHFITRILFITRNEWIHSFLIILWYRLWWAHTYFCPPKWARSIWKNRIIMSFMSFIYIHIASTR